MIVLRSVCWDFGVPKARSSYVGSQVHIARTPEKMRHSESPKPSPDPLHPAMADRSAAHGGASRVQPSFLGVSGFRHLFFELF